MGISYLNVTSVPIFRFRLSISVTPAFDSRQWRLANLFQPPTVCRERLCRAFPVHPFHTKRDICSLQIASNYTGGVKAPFNNHALNDL